MRIDFNQLDDRTIPGMNDGTGTMMVKMYSDDRYRIIPTVLHPGGSIGLLTQNSGDDMNFILSGSGKAVCDDVERASCIFARKVPATPLSTREKKTSGC